MVLLDRSLYSLTVLAGVALVVNVVGQSELAAVNPPLGIDVGEVRLHARDHRVEVAGQGAAFRGDGRNVYVLGRDSWGSLGHPTRASGHGRRQLGGGGRC